MPMVILKIVAKPTKERHVTKNALLQGEIVIDIPMVIIKIVANSREERDVTKKDAIVKRHAMKNVGSREKTKILKDAVVKRHVTKNVGSRGKTKIKMRS